MNRIQEANKKTLRSKILIETYNKKCKELWEYTINKPLEIKEEEIYQLSEEYNICTTYTIHNNGRNPFNINELTSYYLRQHKERYMRKRINKSCKRIKEIYRIILQIISNC